MRLKKKSPDFVLFLTVIILLSIGVIAVYNSSMYSSSILKNDSAFYLKKQVMWALLGTGVMIFLSNFDYWKLKRLIIPGLALTFIFLVLVAIPDIGKVVNGARRWIDLKLFMFQPSEMAKLVLIVFTAYGLSKIGKNINYFWRGIFPFLAVLFLTCGLILLQPDLGTAIALAGTIFVMLIAAGARMAHLGSLAALGASAIAILIWIEPYRMRRITSFWNPFADPLDSGFQLVQSLYALGSGGLFGAEGGGGAKYFYLPEVHTDFIFALIGEQLGFVGGTLIILLFLLFIWRGLKIALYAPDAFSSLLAVGLTSMIGLQAIVNLGVVTGILPTKGIPLPFISYGGTSLIFILAAVGLLLNISKYSTSK